MATTIRRRMMPRLWPAGGAIPVLLLAACAHVEAPAGLQAARTLPSRAWLERITEPGHEVAALASLSMPAGARIRRRTLGFSRRAVPDRRWRVGVQGVRAAGCVGTAVSCVRETAGRAMHRRACARTPGGRGSRRARSSARDFTGSGLSTRLRHHAALSPCAPGGPLPEPGCGAPQGLTRRAVREDATEGIPRRRDRIGRVPWTSQSGGGKRVVVFGQ